jgi:hypothetical protein
MVLQGFRCIGGLYNFRWEWGRGTFKLGWLERGSATAGTLHCRCFVFLWYRLDLIPAHPTQGSSTPQITVRGNLLRSE